MTSKPVKGISYKDGKVKVVKVYLNANAARAAKYSKKTKVVKRNPA